MIVISHLVKLSEDKVLENFIIVETFRIKGTIKINKFDCSKENSSGNMP